MALPPVRIISDSRKETVEKLQQVPLLSWFFTLVAPFSMLILKSNAAPDGKFCA
jgi:hypothetical protein